MGNKRRRKRRESLLGLIRVIIGGQSPQRQLEGVDVTRREVKGENGQVGGVRGWRVVGTTPWPSPRIRSWWVMEGGSLCRLKITRASCKTSHGPMDQPLQE